MDQNLKYFTSVCVTSTVALIQHQINNDKYTKTLCCTTKLKPVEEKKKKRLKTFFFCHLTFRHHDYCLMQMPFKAGIKAVGAVWGDTDQQWQILIGAFEYKLHVVHRPQAAAHIHSDQNWERGKKKKRLFEVFFPDRNFACHMWGVKKKKKIRIGTLPAAQWM